MIGAGDEVVTQTHDVSHLMCDHFAQVGAHIRLLVDAGHFGTHQVQGEVSKPCLLHHAGTHFAAARIVELQRAVQPAICSASRCTVCRDRQRIVKVRRRIDEVRALHFDEARKVRVDRNVGVDDLTGDGVNAEKRDRITGLWGRDPADRVVTHIRMIPIGIVGHLFDRDRVTDSDFFERLVPHQQRFAHRVAVLERDRIVEPENDLLLRLRHRQLRIQFLHIPAIDIAHHRIIEGVVVVALVVGQEVADARVCQTRAITVVGQCKQRVVDAERDAAPIRERRVGAAPDEMVLRIDDDIFRKTLDRGDVGLLAVHAIRTATAAEQRTHAATAARKKLADLCDVATEELADIDQQRLSIRLFCLDFERFEIGVGK